MNQKGYRIVLIVFLLLLTGTTVNASDAWQLKLYSGKVFWMGKELEQNSSMPFLQKEGVTYIPVRSLENLGIGFARYDSKSRSVHIDPYDALDSGSSSTVYAKNEDDLFQLRINSDKENYQVGEKLEIWSLLTVNNRESVTINHGSPLISYFLIDEDGFTLSDIKPVILKSSTFQPDDQKISVWNGMLAYQYIGAQNGYFDKPNGEALFNREVARPLRLPAGQYTIGAVAEYNVVNENQINIEKKERFKQRLDAKINITINE